MVLFYLYLFINKSMWKDSKSMNTQEKLRKQVKLVKAEYDDIYYKNFAEYLDMNEHSFYNWLSGSYKLSADKVSKLQEILVDLLD